MVVGEEKRMGGRSSGIFLWRNAAQVDGISFGPNSEKGIQVSELLYM